MKYKYFFILLFIINISYGSLESDLASIPTFPYEENVWDCSDMSFYVRGQLENLGYVAWVVMKNGDPGHAWVVVISDTEIITIESTTMEIVPFRDDFDLVFEDVNEALNYGISYDEVDWWNHSGT